MLVRELRTRSLQAVSTFKIIHVRFSKNTHQRKLGVPACMFSGSSSTIINDRQGKRRSRHCLNSPPAPSHRDFTENVWHSSSCSHDESPVALMEITPESPSFRVAAPIRERVRQYIANLPKDQPVPHLVGILAETCDNQHTVEASREYAEEIADACKADGIRYTQHYLTNLTTVDHLKQAMAQILEQSPITTGVLVFYPIFSLKRGPPKDVSVGVYFKSCDDAVRDLVSPKLDVEGLCGAYNARFLHRDPEYVVRLHEPSPFIFPCTPAAVVKLLQSYPDLFNTNLPMGSRFQSSVVTIINRSDVVGRPLAAMLHNDGASKVYSIDENSILLYQDRTLTDKIIPICRDDPQLYLEHLQRCIQESNIIISGVPQENFVIPSDWLVGQGRQPKTLVNVAHVKNFCAEELAETNLRYIPSVGKITVAMVLHNLTELHERQRLAKKFKP